jgi:aryl-alcohol dehydrogenase-like predicted oxidoreductase
MSYGSPEWRPWVLGESEAEPFFREAVDKGINFFDTADYYSLGHSEEITGKFVKKYLRRSDAVIATKVGLAMGNSPNARGLSRKHIIESIDGSLKRLGTDYIDLYQIHRLDRSAPTEEILHALDFVVRAGKVLYLGASSMWSWEFMKMLGLQDQHGLVRFISMQNHYNLLYREEEREMLPLCSKEGVGVIPWSPLARGLLGRAAEGEGTTRKTSDDYAKEIYGAPHEGAVLKALAKVSAALGRPPAQVALAWLSSKAVVTAPIIGATRLSHIGDAVESLSLSLDPEIIDILEKQSAPRRPAGID